MTKPSDEWVDAYIDSHPDSCIADAELAWWDEQIDKGADLGNLTPEQERISKEARQGKAVDAFGKVRTRTRTPNEFKRRLLSWVRVLLEGAQLRGDLDSVTLDNPERSISFTAGGKSYTLTLTEHRQPKG